METVLLALMPILAGDAPAPEPGPSALTALFPVFIMIFIFYFLLIRPQRKHQKDRQAMIQALQKHDQILTRGGIIGTVAEIRADREELVVEIAKGTRVRLRRAAVEAVFPRESAEAKGDREKNR